jgi:Carbohydrate esterase, sialic acid-specific acetylesterase
MAYIPNLPTLKDVGSNTSLPFVILAMGQSNMVGVSSEGRKTVSPGIYITNSNVVPTAIIPAQFGVAPLNQVPYDGTKTTTDPAVASNNQAVQFANYLRDSGMIPATRDIVIVFMAVGGTPISQWIGAGTGSPYWNWLNLYHLPVLEAAYPGAKIDHMMWDQGEADGVGGATQLVFNSTITTSLTLNNAIQTAITFTAALAGATSGTLTAAFTGTTGSYNILFSDGSARLVTLTNGSTAVSWTGAVTATTAATYGSTTPLRNPLTFSGALTAATSATITGGFTGTTGSYQVTFSDGSVKTVTLTSGSASVSWTGAVTATASATYGVTSALVTPAFTGTSGTYQITFSDSSTRIGTFTNGSTAISWTTAINLATDTASVGSLGTVLALTAPLASTLTFTTVLTGLTSGTLTAAFTGASGTYPIQFANSAATTRLATFTNGSTTVTWGNAPGGVTPATVKLGSLSATLASAFTGDTGTYTIMFSDNSQQSVTLTNGSTALSWLTPVFVTTSSITTGSTSGTLTNNWTGTSANYNVMFSDGTFQRLSLTNGSNILNAPYSIFIWLVNALNNATTATLKYTFTGATGSYNILFSDGSVRTTTLTNGSTGPISWTGAVTANNQASAAVASNLFTRPVIASGAATAYQNYQSKSMYVEGFNTLLNQCRSLSVWQPNITKVSVTELMPTGANNQQGRNDALYSLRDGLFDPLVTFVSGSGTAYSVTGGPVHYDGNSLMLLAERHFEAWVQGRIYGSYANPNISAYTGGSHVLRDSFTITAGGTLVVNPDYLRSGMCLINASGASSVTLPAAEYVPGTSILVNTVGAMTITVNPSGVTAYVVPEESTTPVTTYTTKNVGTAIMEIYAAPDKNWRIKSISPKVGQQMAYVPAHGASAALTVNTVFEPSQLRNAFYQITGTSLVLTLPDAAVIGDGASVTFWTTSAAQTNTVQTSGTIADTQGGNNALSYTLTAGSVATFITLRGRWIPFSDSSQHTRYHNAASYTSGQTISILAGYGYTTYTNTNTATLAALTINLPTWGGNGAEIRLLLTGAVTAITWTGGTVIGTKPTTVTPNSVITFVWNQTTASWYLINVNTNTGNQRLINTVTTSTTLAATGNATYYYLVNSASVTTQTLPTAVGNTDTYVIKNINTGVVTVATTSSQTIDGVTTQTLPTQNQFYTIISDGANWRLV